MPAETSTIVLSPSRRRTLEESSHVTRVELGDTVLSENCLFLLFFSYESYLSYFNYYDFNKILKLYDLFTSRKRKEYLKIRFLVIFFNVSIGDYWVLFLHWLHASVPASKCEADLVDSWDLGTTAILLFLYDCTELLTMYELEKTRDIISTERISLYLYRSRKKATSTLSS